MNTLFEPKVEPKRHVCVAMHDVSPVTWPACEHLLSALNEVQPVPATLLVVPHFHRGLAARHEPDFEALLGQRLDRGDELALHGLHHWDDQPVTGIFDRVRRRWYTAGEGEFSALSAVSARQRLESGVAWFASNGWPLHGFVAPAWLMSAGTMQALSDMPFSYTTTLNRFILLPELDTVHAPSLVYSVRSGWRRALSKRWLDRLAKASAEQPVLRLGLHPADAEFPEVIRHWQILLAAALETRVAVTKFEAAHWLRNMQGSTMRSNDERAQNWSGNQNQINQMESSPVNAPKMAPPRTSLG